MEKRILAIDPGYERLGLAILEKRNEGEFCIFSETFQTSAKLDFKDRLFQIGKRVEFLLDSYGIEVLVLEDLFFNTNQKTALKVSEVRGVLIYLALNRNIKVFEYTPLQIKTAITGYGRADKKQILFMLKRLVKIEKDIKYDDEYDAIAIGLTFFAYNKIW